jgi:tRNA U34 5-methylaminomethyl-2-thiouridine-forming methyltransferase MnmC
MFALLPEATKNPRSENDVMSRKFDSVETCANDERISRHRLLGPVELRQCDLGEVRFATQTTTFCTLA